MATALTIPTARHLALGYPDFPPLTPCSPGWRRPCSATRWPAVSFDQLAWAITLYLMVRLRRTGSRWSSALDQGAARLAAAAATRLTGQGAGTGRAAPA
jgi:hypothetical protein